MSLNVIVREQAVSPSSGKSRVVSKQGGLKVPVKNQSTPVGEKAASWYRKCGVYETPDGECAMGVLCSSLSLECVWSMPAGYNQVATTTISVLNMSESVEICCRKQCFSGRRIYRPANVDRLSSFFAAATSRALSSSSERLRLWLGLPAPLPGLAKYMFDMGRPLPWPVA